MAVAATIADLVVAADGINSLVRKEYESVFKPDIDTRLCKFIWLGTHQKFDDAFTFIFEETDKGWLWAHAYQFDDDTATFIVETDEDTWNAFWLTAVEGQDCDQVASQLGKNRGAVYAARSRVMRRIQEQVTELEREN